MKLAGGFLGQLRHRDRISSRTLSESRKLVPPPLPVDLYIKADVEGGAALAVVGFLGADAAHPAELRTLGAAAKLLNENVKAALANGGVENNGVGASVVPAVAYPGFGAVIVTARVARPDADRATAVMSKAIRDYVDAGETDEFRVDRIGYELAQAAGKFERDQRYWSGILARACTLGVDPDELADAPTFFQALDAAPINTVLKRNATPERMFKVVVGG
jgi:hypothetical protein